jgi:hypothetical protein|tara:strand:+ start:825 stop:1163 length:339 start_codon:yes stop_codon:yes gene_type:complete
MKKDTKYKIIRLLMNIVFVYFIVFCVMIYGDSKKRPELYSVPKPPQSHNPAAHLIVPNLNDIVEENNRLKNMYWHWMGLYNNWIYPMLFFILGLFVVRLLLDNSDFIKYMDD